MPRNIGPRPLPDPQFDLHRRRQCRRACDPHRPAPQNRRTPGGGLCRPFWPHSGGVHPPDGRKQRLRPLALSQEALAAGLVDRIIEPAATEKTPAAQATPAGQWRKLLGKLGLVRPADALPPDRNILHFGDPEKGPAPHFGTRPARRPAIRGSDPHAPPRRSVDRRNDSLGQPASLCRRCKATDPVKPAR